MKIKALFTKNLGLKITAFLIAFAVWIAIAGKQRAFSEKIFDINIETYNVSENIDIRSIKPNKIRVRVKGTSSRIKKLKDEDFSFRVDLKDVREAGKLNFMTEDILEHPEEVEVLSLHPKKIVMDVEEFGLQEVDVKVLFTGWWKRGVKFLEMKVLPEKVHIFGYKSSISKISRVYIKDKIDRSRIDQSVTLRLKLKKNENIIRFEETDTVEVKIRVDSPKERKKNEK